MSTSTTAKLSKTAKKKKKRQLTNRHGIMLIGLLAVTILVVNMVVFSYSWFTPTATPGVGLSLDTTSSIRSERCVFETYLGTLVTDTNWDTLQSGQTRTFKAQGYYIDQVAYSADKIEENDKVIIPTARTVNGEIVPGRVYFRTNIQNTDREHPSVISLYHHEFPDTLGIGVTYPSNTYFINDFGDYPDCFIMRNAYVKKLDDADVDGPGLLQVEWFVENFSTTQTKEIRVSRQTKDGGTFAADASVGSLMRYQSGGSDLTAPIEWLYLMYN